MTKFNPLAFYGDSTGFGMKMAKEISRDYKLLYTSGSFSGKLAQGDMYPSVFVAGPTYADQVSILCKYVAKVKPKAKVALFYADSPFGRDPIRFGKIMLKRLRLKLAAEVTAKIGDTDISQQLEVIKKAQPDCIIFHGFLGKNPVPTAIRELVDSGVDCLYMGTYYATSKMLVDSLGQYADYYYGVSPYSFWWQEDVPAIRKIREFNATNHPDVTFRPVTYMQGFLVGSVFVEVLRKADRNDQLNRDGIIAALKSIKDFDTHGLTAPLTVRNNRFPIARIWKGDSKTGTLLPASDWIPFY